MIAMQDRPTEQHEIEFPNGWTRQPDQWNDGFAPRFPRVIDTKGRAKMWAERLFPDYRAAARFVIANTEFKDRDLTEDPALVSILVESRAERSFATLLDWMLDKNSRLYKRARIGFTHDVAERLKRLLHDAYEARDRAFRDDRWREELAKRQAVQLVQGLEGEGI